MMQIQRKLLTDEQRQKICSGRPCNQCPLKLSGQVGENKSMGVWARCKEVKALEKLIKDYWNEEVEVDL